MFCRWALWWQVVGTLTVGHMLLDCAVFYESPDESLTYCRLSFKETDYSWGLRSRVFGSSWILSLSHPGILGMTLCFCTGSYADYLIRFWSIFVVTLTLNFQGQIWNSSYLGQKWLVCHETKNKYNDWTLSLKCDHWIWPWPWPWPWIFKVKYEIRYILDKNGLIATKQKANISIELQASNVNIDLHPCHDID